MINLEWLRTFRAVYKTKSLSRASEILNISQPTVSQHIQGLEVHIGQKLFTRKSKGVLETDDGRILNTLVSGSIEALEEAENRISQRYADKKTILTIGISQHLYKSMLSDKLLKLGEYVHVKFGTKQSLIKDVEEGRLLYAIVPDVINTFDIICHPLFKQNLLLVSTPDVDLGQIEFLCANDTEKAEQLLTAQTWYAHDPGSSYIKLFWLDVFNKNRPTIIPNIVIPDEFEVLNQLTKGCGITVALDTNAQFFLKEKLLKAFDIAPVYFRPISLLSNKKRASREMTSKIIDFLSE